MQKLLAIFIIWVMAMPCLAAEKIHTWIDAEGVIHFSDSPPPEGVEHYDTIQSPSTEPDVKARQQGRRQAYDRMVEQSVRETRQIQMLRKNKAAARAAELKREAEKRRQTEIQAERRRLEQKINALKARALSPTFSQGMRQAQIEKIQAQIEQLEKTGKTE